MTLGMSVVSWRLISAVVGGLLLAVICEKAVAVNSPAAQVTHATSVAAIGRCQSLSGAREGVQYCQAPIHAILANSDAFDGRQMATFGYLLHEKGPRDVLGPFPDALRRIDFLSCVDVDLAGVRYEDSTTDLEPGIYFVMVQGRYTDGAVNGACVGSFSEPYISRILRVQEP